MLKQLGQQALGMLTGNAIGSIFGMEEDRRQLNQAAALQDLQMRGARAMGIFNREQQMKLWEDTNYHAQVEQLKKAGLNVGLMYQQGGPGGTTQAQPGNVQGQNAQNFGYQGMELAMRMADQKANLELLNAQTEKVKAEAQNIEADTTNKPIQGELLNTQIKDLLQGIENKEVQKQGNLIDNKLKNLQFNFENKTFEDRIDIVNYEAKKISKELSILEDQAYINRETRNTIVNSIRQDLTLKYLDGILKVTQNEKEKMAIENLKKDLEVKDSQMLKMANDTLLDVEKFNQTERIEQFKSKMQEMYPNMGQVGGKLIDELYEGISDIFEYLPSSKYKVGKKNYGMEKY